MPPVEQAELVIIGGGPAGLSAAIEARRAGVSVTILEERSTLGGQIFKQFGPGFSVVDPDHVSAEYRRGRRLIDDAERSGTDIRSGAVVWGIWDKQIAFVQDETRAGVIDAVTIILATGARDRPLAFPGWTLPGVLTAGAAKSLVATQRILPGRRILMAGSGPLALAFSAQLVEFGANIVEVTEAAPPPRPADVVRLVASASPSVLADAVRYRARLMRLRIPVHYSTMIVRAHGSTEVDGAVVATVDRDWRVIPGTERALEVDTILLGYGLETSTELSRLCGCQHRFDQDMGGFIPVRDIWLRTSVAGIFAVGDGAGVSGSRNAIWEGRLAGIAAARELGHLTDRQANDVGRPIRCRLRRLEGFRRALARMYPVGPGIYELATGETMVCRCEEVSAGDLELLLDEGVTDPNIVRAMSRAGMGRCQGRNCASQIVATIARRSGVAMDRIEPLTVRPPVQPIPISAIAEERVQRHADVEIS